MIQLLPLLIAVVLFYSIHPIAGVVIAVMGGIVIGKELFS